ncbi:carbohydrate esterase family 4 protein [Pisolithus microcarpus]|nr:carbohydrate esterase family 4 protein [Pisolithus microcarpus]
MLSLLVFSLLVAPAVQAVDSVSPYHHYVNAELPARTWYQPDSHPVHTLFRRAGANDGVTYASVGSPEWSKGFPADPVSMQNMPQAWLDALHKAVSAGKIPDVPVTITPPGSNPTYPDGYDPMNHDVCSSTYQCRIPGDIWDGPDGYLSLSFDDGPLPPSPTLYKFLKEKGQHATHFYIGTNILQYPDCFEMAWENQDDIAVHTWTHPYMTTKTNEEVLAELGWTMQLIHNSTGGRVPKYWRPPYGDSDMRVRAIAKEVLGLTTVIWNQDTNDWSLSDPVPITSLDKIATQMHTWLTGSKKPGLIILEHELSNQSVQAFMDAWDLVVSNGWKTTSVAQMEGASAYQNSWNASGPVMQAKVGDLSVHPPPSQTAESTTSKPSPSSTDAKSSRPNNTSNKSSALHYGASSVTFGVVASVAVAVAVYILS